MNFDNVNLWFAKDSKGEIVTINEVDKNIKEDYFCPICGSSLIPRQGKEKAWHFAHDDASKCNAETMYHWWIKNKLIEIGDEFIIESDTNKKYKCKEILVEQSYNVNGKIYKPDVTIVTDTDEIIYFEMDYTNKKKLEDYIDIWMELGNTVVEIDVKTLINNYNSQLFKYKALYYKGKCYNTKKTDDNIYYETIGKYKEENHKKVIDKETKKEIENLDWLWKDIQKYKQGTVGIEQISESIQSIEKQKSREVAVNVLRKAKCNHIIKDYIEYNNNKVRDYIKLTKLVDEYAEDDIKLVVNYNTPRLLYDRVYHNGIDIDLFTMHDIIFFHIKTYDIEEIKNIPRKIPLNYLYIEEVLNWCKKNIPQYNNYLNLCCTEYPAINYYLSWNCEHRIYLNNFIESSYGDYISIYKIETIEEAIKYLENKLNFNKIFNDYELKLLDKISNDLAIKYSSDDIKIKVCIRRGYILEVYVNYLNKNTLVYNISKEGIVTINDTYLKISRSIELKMKNILLEIDDIKKMNKIKKDIYNEIDNLNKKYSSIKSEWSCYQDYFCNYIGLRRLCYEGIEIGKEAIKKYKDGTIALEQFKEIISDEISDHIRGQIYGNNLKSKRRD